MPRGDHFWRQFDCEVELAGAHGHAWFGRDVLRGLVEGLEEFAARPKRFGSRDMGTGLIACSPWLNDSALVAAIAAIDKACAVTTKRRTGHTSPVVRRLRALNERLAGIPVRAFPELAQMHPVIEGKPIVLRPYDQIESDVWLPTFRTLGERAARDSHPPIAHAKLALLGRFWWSDEGPLGHVDDIVGFRAMRLWVSSANFSVQSRTSIEFGYWTEGPELMDAVQQFLVRLIGASEDFDTEADAPTPDLGEAELDMEALADLAAELMEPGEGDDAHFEH